MNEIINFGNFEVNTSAQAMTLMAFSDCPHLKAANIPFSQLHFSAQCENFSDLCSCLKLIQSYDSFDAAEAIEAMTPFLSVKQWFPEGNPNHGREMYRLTIAREYKPAIYIEYSTFLQDKIINSDNPDRNAFEKFTSDDFEDCMNCLNIILKPTEFSIDKTQFVAQNELHTSYRIRLYWS